MIFLNKEKHSHAKKAVLGASMERKNEIGTPNTQKRKNLRKANWC